MIVKNRTAFSHFGDIMAHKFQQIRNTRQLLFDIAQGGEWDGKNNRSLIIFLIFSLFIPAVLNIHLSVTLMYINSHNTAVRSSISYYSFRYFIVVSFRRHVSAHSFGPSSGLQIY